MEKNMGIVTKEADGYSVRLDRVIRHPAQKVWEALTDPALLRIWFTDVEMDFREGGSMTIYFRDEERSKSYGKILKIVPGRLFQFNWEDELATFELSEEGKNACRLRLTYSRMSDRYAYSVPAGWHQLLDQLEQVMAGRTEPYPFGGEETPEGKALREKYKERVYADFPGLKQKEHALVVERTYNATADQVWRAITNKEEMKRWYFDLKEFRAEKGFKFQFEGGPDDGVKYLHLCEVTEVIKEKKISYTWKYEGYEGCSEVSFELFPEGGKTRLVVTHAGLETFPANNTDFARKNFEAGWNDILGNMLKKYLEEKINV